MQPDLLDGDQVTLEYEDRRRVVQRLAACPELPTLNPPLYGPHILCVTLCLAGHEELPMLALNDVEAHP